MTKTAARVRAAVVDDVPRIAEICTTAYRVTYADLLPDDYIERTIRDFYHPDRLVTEVAAAPPNWFGYQVVEQDGLVLGAAGGGMIADLVGELFVLYLDPQQRGRGLGTMLLNRVISQVRDAGAAEIWVSVTPGNELAIPFYRARQFQEVETVTAYASRPEDNIRSLRMRRRLMP